MMLTGRTTKAICAASTYTTIFTSCGAKRQDITSTGIYEYHLVRSAPKLTISIKDAVSSSSIML